MVLYFMASPVIFTNASQGPTASPLLYKLYGPVLRVLESDFKGPVLWYFGLWGIGIEYFAVEPAPKPPWYVGPVYASIAGGTVVALMCPLLRSAKNRSRQTRDSTLFALSRQRRGATTAVVRSPRSKQRLPRAVSRF